MELLESVDTYLLPTVLLLAWLLDLVLGDPLWLPHPVVYMGRWISFWEKVLNRNGGRRFKGAVLAMFSIVGVWSLSWLAFRQIKGIDSFLYVFCSAFILFFCLAGHTLRKEVRMVFEALEKGLDEGRRQVARIVGRDTANLSAQEVRTAALETLAENLSDGVIAPLFWFMLLGVPGALAYKMVNTLDSMIGYRNERFRDFGCWAAHIDDVANYIPARITALLIIVAGGMSRKRLGFLMKYGPQHASPNSGWPEAALASILDCRFGGPHNYFGREFYKPYIGENPRTLTFEDMARSIRVCMVAEIISVSLSLVILILWSVLA